MISREKLNQIAQARNLTLQNAERDYILEALLFSISKRAANKLVFKGGTALYKFYGINRFSEDLDFTLNRGTIDRKFFELVLQDLWQLNLKGWIKAYDEYRNEINVHLRFAGLLYDGNVETLCSASINISLRETTSDPKIEFLISSYDIPAFSVPIMQDVEILAEKVRAILTRDKARDIYDLWFLLKKGVKFDEQLANRKLKIHKLKYFKEKLFEKIAKLKVSWLSDLGSLIIGEVPRFEDVILYIKLNL